jgi:hypothetical protein
MISRNLVAFAVIVAVAFFVAVVTGTMGLAGPYLFFLCGGGFILLGASSAGLLSLPESGARWIGDTRKYEGLKRNPKFKRIFDAKKLRQKLELAGGIAASILGAGIAAHAVLQGVRAALGCSSASCWCLSGRWGFITRGRTRSCWRSRTGP